MSKEPIVIDANLEFSDYFRPLFRVFFRRLWYFFIVLVLYSLFSLRELLYGRLNSGNLFSLMPVVLLFVLVWSIFSTAKKFSKAAQGTSRYVFSENEIDINTSNSASQIKWSFFEKVEETKKDFLLFQNKTRFHPIPKRYFKDREQMNEFKEIVRAQLGEKAQLKND